MAASKPKRVRQEFADWQKEILENFFQVNWNFSTEDYISLGARIKEAPIRVKHWLNNRRHKAKVTGEREGVLEWRKRPAGQPRPPVIQVQRRKYQRKSNANSNTKPTENADMPTSNSIVPYEVSVDVPAEADGAPLRFTISYTLPQEASAEERQAMKRARDESCDEISSKKFKAADGDSKIQDRETDLVKILQEFENYIPEDASSLAIPATPAIQENDDDDQFDISDFLVFNKCACEPNDIVPPAKVSSVSDFNVNNYQQYSHVPGYQNAAQPLPPPIYYSGNYSYYEYPVAHYSEYPIGYHPEYSAAYHSQYPVANQSFYDAEHMYGRAVNNVSSYQ